MEALVAFGLAANVMQVVAFAGEILTNANQIFRAGSTVQNKEIEIVASDLKALNDRLVSFARPDPSVQGPLAEDEQALNNMADEVDKIAQELHTTLVGICNDKARTRSRSFVQAVKTAMKSSKIKELKSRLQWIRDELEFRILVSIKSSIDLSAVRSSSDLGCFDEVTRNIVTAIIENKQNLHFVVEEQNKSITKYFAAAERSADRRHEETMTEIQKLSAGMLPSSLLKNDEAVDPHAVFRRLKRLLDYEKMDDRYEEIKPAYSSTFEWVYDPQRDKNTTWPSLTTWLQEQGSLYWISGKAGSGKSTLMKFISQDERTSETLKSWAGAREILKLSFYFWNLGTELQKSTKGLYQSVLHQALIANKDLGPVLFAEQYEPDARWQDFPTRNQLRRAYQRLVSQKTVSLCILFLIDGLDEFEDAEDSMDELAEMFTCIAENTNVKAILSSRPYQAFVHAFAKCPEIKLQDLTRSDITTYVNGQLRTHDRMIELTTEHPKEAEKLITVIVESASGVFLWVKLVVRSLLEGLRNQDDISDLQTRLKELPKDLETLFQHMLSKIAPQYKKQGAELFQILRRSQDLVHEHWPSEKSHRAGVEPPLTALDVYATGLSATAVSDRAIGPMQKFELDQREREVEARLRSRCAGLIELQSSTSTESAVSLNKAAQASSDVEGSILKSGRQVQYLHKSVADFLSIPTVWQNIVQDTADANFDPNLPLLKAMVLRVKICTPDEPLDTYSSSGVWKVIRSALRLARQADSSNSRSLEQLLDDLDQTMVFHYTRLSKLESVSTADLHRYNHGWCDTIPEDYRRPAAWHDNFLALAIRSGLQSYVMSKLEDHGTGLPRKAGRPLLDYACRPEPAYPEWVQAIDPDIVRVLLQHGADPNEKFNGFSAWQNTLYKGYMDPKILLKIVLLLLKHGADVNAFVEDDMRLSKRHWQKRRQSVMYLILELFAKYDTDDFESEVKDLFAEVIKVMRQRKARVYVMHAVKDAGGVILWEEQALTRDEAPFLSTADIISMTGRRHISWSKTKILKTFRTYKLNIWS